MFLLEAVLPELSCCKSQNPGNVDEIRGKKNLGELQAKVASATCKTRLTVEKEKVNFEKEKVNC